LDSLAWQEPLVSSAVQEGQDSLEHLVTQVTLDTLDFRDRPDSLDHLERLGSQDLRDPSVQLEIKELLVQQEQLELLVSLDHRGQLGSLAKLDHPVCLELKVSKVGPEQQEPLDRVAARECRDPRVRQVLLATLVQLDNKDLREQQDHLELRELMASRGSRV
jgi:hypothetical protein